MIAIGWRNLRKDPARLSVAVLGVAFAVLLVTVEVGMLLGLVRNASLLIDHSRADLWVSLADVKTLDFGTPMDQRNRYRIEAIAGVARVEEFNVSYSVWKLPSGANANVQIIGFDEEGTLAPCLNLVAGDLRDLHNQDAIVIDEGERAKLGGVELGDRVEIMGRRAKVVGFTQQMRSFTTTPYCFTSLKQAKHYGWLDEGATNASTFYFLVKLAPGADAEAVRARIAEILPEVEVHSREAFSWRTRRYWLVETGVGLGFLAAAFLGLIVGGVVVSQTLYAMTVERLPEFGVLKAMGFGMGALSRVVLEQGLICGGAGLAIGLAASLAARGVIAQTGTTMETPWPLLSGVVLLTVVLCSCAAVISIRCLRRIEPAMVFRA